MRACVVRGWARFGLNDQEAMSMKANAGVRVSDRSRGSCELPASAQPGLRGGGGVALRAGLPGARTLFGPAQANAFLEEMISPWIQDLGLTVEACSPSGAALRLPRSARLLRLGETLSGPALMACAHTAMAIAVMGDFGELRNVAAVSLTVDFMSPIAAGDVTIGATVRRRGHSLSFTECTFFEPRNRDVAVHATATWALTPATAVRRWRNCTEIREL
jgi:acyl-coenzyme A thioesterase PaaI-like protein